MLPGVEEMEAQLERWRSQIDRLAAKAQGAGGESGFDALMYVDELKALHVVATFKLVELKEAEEATRKRLQAEMKRAWAELEAAFKSPMP
jgi:hypothetical protein